MRTRGAVTSLRYDALTGNLSSMTTTSAASRFGGTRAARRTSHPQHDKSNLTKVAYLKLMDHHAPMNEGRWLWHSLIVGRSNPVAQTALQRVKRARPAMFFQPRMQRGGGSTE